MFGEGLLSSDFVGEERQLREAGSQQPAAEEVDIHFLFMVIPQPP